MVMVSKMIFYRIPHNREFVKEVNNLISIVICNVNVNITSKASVISALTLIQVYNYVCILSSKFDSGL